MQIVVDETSPEDLRAIGLAVEQQELVFQNLVQSRMALEVILAEVQSLPLIDAEEFQALSPQALDQLDEIEKLLEAQVAKIGEQLGDTSDEALFAAVAPYSMGNKLAQPLKQQLEYAAVDNLRLHKRVFKTRGRKLLGEQLDFNYIAQNEAERQDTREKQQPHRADGGVELLEQNLKATDFSNGKVAPELLAEFQREYLNQETAHHCFDDQEFYAQLLKQLVDKNADMELVAELKKAQQRYQKALGSKAAQKPGAGTESFLFKRLQGFCIPEPRANNEYLNLLRGELFGVKQQ